jgi:hypothetical protein
VQTSNTVIEIKAANNSSALAAKILAAKRHLENNTDSDEAILNELSALHNISITLEILRSTRIGATVASLKKSKNGAISLLAKELVAKWKVIARTGEQVVAAVPSSEDDIACNQTVLNANDLPNLEYTVKIPHEDGSFHVEENIAVDRVKYRHETNTKHKHAKSDPAQQSDAIIGHGLGDIEIESDRCPVYTSSAPTISDITMNQSKAGENSHRGSHKRKLGCHQSKTWQIHRLELGGA